jgi:hypothetical protein
LGFALMSFTSRRLAVSAVALWLSLTAGSAFAQQQVKLGWLDCSTPLLLLEPTVGLTVRLSMITYDAGGYVSAFREVIDMSAGSSLVVQVTMDAFEGCPTRTARASASDSTQIVSRYGDFKPAESHGLIGFSAKDLGGVVVIGPVEGSLQNEFAYDTVGQRRLSRQQFSIQRTVYVIEYSNVIMDRGRLVGYDAKILTGR